MFQTLSARNWMSAVTLVVLCSPAVQAQSPLKAGVGLSASVEPARAEAAEAPSGAGRFEGWVPKDFPPPPPAPEKAALFEALKQAAPPIACLRQKKFSRRGTNQVMFAHRATEGSEILVFDPKTPAVAPRVVFATEKGFILDLSPSYDGKKLLFSLRETPDQPYHLWEIRADGSRLRQLTRGNHHDFNPVYYPDGRIVFSSSRAESYSMCQDFLACALHICDADGSNLRRIDFTTLTSTTPSILPDGRILFTRWEYQDKNIFSWQGLWTLYPDGRNLKLYYGNTFVVPNGFYGAKPVPGTSAVLSLMVAHHHPPLGDLTLIHPERGLENPEGLTRLTRFTPWQPTQGSGWRTAGLAREWQPGDSHEPWSVTDAFPYSTDASVMAYGNRIAQEFEIALLDHRTGDHFPILARPGTSFACPVPLSPRPLPVALAGEVPLEAGVGSFHVVDIYQGLLEKGVRRGEVKELRVMRPVPKKYNTEGPRYHDTYPLVGAGTYYVKENLGTVPVQPDGSVFFQAPSNCELYFQALDAAGREISRMGSVTQITTGETVSCLGCHEDRIAPPATAYASVPKIHGQAATLTPPPWGAGPVDYVRHVQPVFDRHCVSCHSGEKPQGGLDFSGDITRFFNLSYETMIVNELVDFQWLNSAPTGVFPPLQTGSRVSKLVALIESGHQKVEVDDEGRRRLYTWIDANVPYYATWDMSHPHTHGGRDIFSRAFVEAVQKILDRRKLAGFSFHINTNSYLNKTFYKINITHPSHSRLLTENLAASAGGLAPDERAVFKDRSDPDYLALLELIGGVNKELKAKPRMDMPGAVPVPQERNFGRVF